MHGLSSYMQHPSYPASTESLLEQPSGSHRVKYRGAGERSKWDFTMDPCRRQIDVSLVLPHYRARNQPLDHRLSMFVGGDDADSIKVKVCRNFQPTRTTKFRLEVHSSSDAADITIWLPSDFKGRIHRSSRCQRMSFSAGFTNRIMQNVSLTQSRRPSLVADADKQSHQISDIYIAEKASAYPQEDAWSASTLRGDLDEDEVVVITSGQVTFRMWDVHRGEPEARCREACKRVFGWCTKRAPEVAIDWDFLLDD
ncbi:hypothetical protein WOLCODRAFT_136266 [Wolfiporia cocos MD-104 SS10]|uniref:DUF7330 domain-containing protein n=1 Tax=Wolfiporia cocos (strain MD-104) TaxID=742152 RepID=A0A2H3J881_WOLCO|nr:hypothetical protein WOLCODRAFT_136266 [Wolfiporia cocos MD-104 SS10]